MRFIENLYNNGYIYFDDDEPSGSGWTLDEDGNWVDDSGWHASADDIDDILNSLSEDEANGRELTDEELAAAQALSQERADTELREQYESEIDQWNDYLNSHGEEGADIRESDQHYDEYHSGEVLDNTNFGDKSLADIYEKTLSSSRDIPQVKQEVQNLINNVTSFAKNNNLNAEQTNMLAQALAADHDMRLAFNNNARIDNGTVSTQERIATAVLGKDDNAAVQIMAEYGFDPTGIHSKQEAKYIQEAYQSNPSKKTMNALEKQYSEVYNARNKLLKDVGTQTALMVGPSLIGPLAKSLAVAATGSKIGAGGAVIGTNAAGLQQAAVELLSKLGSGFATAGGGRLDAYYKGMQGLLNATDKGVALLDLIAKGVSVEEAVRQTAASKSEDYRRPELTDSFYRAGENFSQLGNDFLNAVAPKTDYHGNTGLVDQATRDKSRGKNITIDPSQIGSQGTGTTWNLQTQTQFGTGVPLTPGNQKISDFGPVIVVENQTKTPGYSRSASEAYYDSEYEAKAGLQNQLAGYGVGHNKSEEPQADFSSSGLPRRIDDDNPGEGDETDYSVDDSPGNQNNPSNSGNGDSGGNNNNNPGNEPKPPENNEEIKDKNGEAIDWNVNKNRIGLSKDPNRADYDLDKWNRGMEIQSTDMVSDERVKSYLTLSYNRDPIFTKLANKLRRSK